MKLIYIGSIHWPDCEFHQFENDLFEFNFKLNYN